MARTWIKICGVRTPAIAAAAVEAGADAVGLMFAPRSPRLVTPDEARAIVAVLPTFIGDRLSLDLYLVALINFGFRIFNNVALIRRHLI